MQARPFSWSCLAVVLASLLQVIASPVARADPRCDLVDDAGNVKSGASYGWEMRDLTLKTVQAPRNPDSATYDVSDKTTADVSFVIVDKLRNKPVSCVGKTYPGLEERAYSCRDENGDAMQDPWLSFSFMAWKSLYVKINETWTCDIGSGKRATVQAVGGLNFRWFSCNGNADSTYWPGVGVCKGTTYPDNGFDPGPNWTYATYSISSESIVSIPPAPNRQCETASAEQASWEVRDFVFQTGLDLLTAIGFGPVPDFGRITFRLINTATGYSPDMICTATEPSLTRTQTTTSLWYCSVANARAYDVVPTNFQFNPSTGELRIEQTWTCEGSRGRVKFKGNGKAVLEEVGCGPYTGRADGKPDCPDVVGCLGAVGAEECKYRDAVIRASAVERSSG